MNSTRGDAGNQAGDQPGERPGDRPAGHADRRRRRQRSDGQRSRTAILDEAARLATVEGIGGLSISRLADAVGMSKSGLFAHFGSKEELQLATIDTATAVFDDLVLAPAGEATDGLDRLRRLVAGYLHYLEVDAFPGGCFFASVLAETDMQPGPVRDRLVAFLRDWLGRLESVIREAQAQGSLSASEDAAQLTFEIEAALFLANAQHVVSRAAEPIERARAAIDRRLNAAGVGAGSPPAGASGAATGSARDIRANRPAPAG